MARYKSKKQMNKVLKGNYGKDRKNKPNRRD